MHSQKFYFTNGILLAILFLASCKSSVSTSGGNVAGGNGNKGSINKVAVNQACNNAYYPASPTLKRTYKSVYAGNRMPPATYTESFPNFTSDGYAYRLDFSGREGTKDKAEKLMVEGGIKCTPQGLMMMEYANLQAGSDVHMKVKTIKAEGVTYPNESEWQIGKKWDMKYDVEVEFEKNFAPGMQVSPKGTYEMHWEIVGKESVTVPAGTFDALKVVMTFKNDLSMSMNGAKIPMATTFQSTVWFAKDVGMVKNVVDKMATTTELMALTK